MKENDDPKYKALQEEYQFVYRWQRRFLIEIAILVGFICLIVGFLAGAAWQWRQFSEAHPAIMVEPDLRPSAHPNSTRPDQ